MYIDTHAHLTFPQFKDDLDQIIARAKEVKLETIINIALGYEALEQSLKIAEKYPNYVFTAFGLHPHEAKDCTDEIFVTTKKLALDKKIVAIGEMGLDYFYKHSPPPVQQEVFRKFFPSMKIQFFFLSKNLKFLKLIFQIHFLIQFLNILKIHPKLITFL